MGLEHWDAARGRWIMYRSQEDHSEDCRNHPFENVPRKVFLDTNVVNLLIKYRETIFEQGWVPENLPTAMAHDVEALLHLMAIGSRANWHMVVSAKSIEEIEKTSDPYVRQDLLNYAWEVAETRTEESAFADRLGRDFAEADLLQALPDVNDRMLIGNAIGLGCDVFCTRDVRTIVRKRDAINTLPIRITTPVEWWRTVKPWGGLWV